MTSTWLPEPAQTPPRLGFELLRDDDYSRISAYARLDFDNYTFFVQTLQVVLGRKGNHEAHAHSVDVHLSLKKAILRRHAKIFYNFGTQRFELSVMGRNGAFVDDAFVEKGMTVPLVDGTKIQVGDIPFSFVLPSVEPQKKPKLSPSDVLNLRTILGEDPRALPKPAVRLAEHDSELDPAIVGMQPKMGRPAAPLHRAHGGYSTLAARTAPQISAPVAHTAQQLRPQAPPQRAVSLDGGLDLAPVCVLKTLETPSAEPKVPRRRDVRKIRAPALRDEPHAKPALSTLALVAQALRALRGLTFAELHAAIREAHPYYHTVDGWQAVVTHTVRFGGMFVPLAKTGVQAEWRWAVDEAYVAEREAVRQRLQERAAARAREALAAGLRPAREPKPESIKEQLAANRARPHDTPKALGYLQKELFTLYKARNLKYNTAETTEIVTKALATTISQVNIIGAKAGCKDNALGALVEKAPQQVTRILDIALTNAIKQKQESRNDRGDERGLVRPQFAGAKGPQHKPQFLSNKPKRGADGDESPNKSMKRE